MGGDHAEQRTARRHHGPVLIVALSIGRWAFSSLSPFLFILLLAWLLSIAMEPIVLFIIRHGINRGLAAGLTMLVIILLFAGLAEVFGQVFISQLADLGQSLPQAVTLALDWVNRNFHTSIDVSTIQQTIASNLTADKIGSFVSQYAGGLLGIFGSVIAFIFDGLTILVFAYFFSADSPQLRQTIGSWLPPRYQQVFVTVWTTSVEKTGGYVISKLVLTGLSAASHIAFFYFINVNFWLPLGLLAGIVGQFIPTIGTYIGVALPALFTLASGRPINAVWIAAFATVYQQVENYIFTPRAWSGSRREGETPSGYPTLGVRRRRKTLPTDEKGPETWGGAKGTRTPNPNTVQLGLHGCSLVGCLVRDEEAGVGASVGGSGVGGGVDAGVPAGSGG